MAKTSLKLVAAIDSNILSYEVLDRVLDRDMFYVYAIQEDTSRYDAEFEVSGRKLQVLQIVYDVFMQGWMQPSLTELNLPLK